MKFLESTAFITTTANWTFDLLGYQLPVAAPAPEIALPANLSLLAVAWMPCVHTHEGKGRAREGRAAGLNLLARLTPRNRRST